MLTSPIFNIQEIKSKIAKATGVSTTIDLQNKVELHHFFSLNRFAKQRKKTMTQKQIMSMARL